MKTKTKVGSKGKTINGNKTTRNESYMKENELTDFNKTIKHLIENGLKFNQEK